VSPSPHRTPRLAPEARRRQIIDATLKVAESEGFAALTIDAVASEAGITRPVIYDLFGDLRGLLAATLADAESRALTTLAAALPDPIEGARPDLLLAEAFRVFLHAVRRDPLTWRLILLPPQGAPPQIRARVDQNRAELAGRVSRLVAWGLGRIAAPEAIDPDVLARLLIAAGEDLARLVLEHPRRYTPSRIARAIEQLASLMPDRSP
jgi:AcrR family transcriptional regulator